jgi:alpha-tubulin suppressor-like RCC1 family protein
VKAIAAGGYHTVALQEDGTVVAWGHNEYGQTTVPVGLKGVKSIASDWYHTIALQEDGTVVAWGANYSGQTDVPEGLTGVKAIAAGGEHTVALLDSTSTMSIKVSKKSMPIVHVSYNGGMLKLSKPLLPGTTLTLFDMKGRILFPIE